jgi:hypothetical protein
MKNIKIIILCFVIIGSIKADELFDESFNKSGRMKIATYVTSQGTQISVDDILNSNGLIDFSNKITSQATDKMPKEFYFHREDSKTFRSKDFRKWTLIPSVASIAGEESFQNENRLIISPNPVREYLSINGHDGERFEIYSVYGIKVIEGICQSKLDVSSLNSGFYILKIGQNVTRFIKI